MTGMEEAAAAALLLRLGASLGAAWLAGRAADGLSKGQTYNNSTAQGSQQSPAEQAQNADNGTQSLSPADPKPPCQDCGKEKEERQKKRRKELEEEAGVKQKTKGRTRHGEKSGGMDQANADFDSLEPTETQIVDTKYGPGRAGILDDGTKLTVRPGSSEGQPTLEFRNSNNGRGTEIRYNP